MLKLLAYSLTLSLAATPALAAGPKYYHQPAAPATCTVGDLWIDTDATAGNQISTCTAANTWTKNQSLVGDCTVGPCLDGSADGGNLIKLWAGTGSYWTALQGGSPAANRSWRLPIAAAPAAGETLVMTMDEYGQMGFLAAPATSGYVLSSTDAGVLSWAAGGSGAGDDLGSAAYSDVVALWTTCTGYLKSDGTCDTPSGSATYPSAAGVANWGGSAWGTSYGVVTEVGATGADTNLPTEQAVREGLATKADLSGTPSFPDGIDTGSSSTGPGFFTIVEDSDNGANYVGVGSPASNDNDLMILLPVSDPTVGQIATFSVPSSVTFADGVVRDATQWTWSDLPTAESLSVDDLISLSGLAEGSTTISDPNGDITATTFDGALTELAAAVELNTAKVSNATHTGDVTGATELTIAADAVGTDELSNTLTLVTTGTIQGRVVVETDADGKTLDTGDNATMQLATGAGTWTLPDIDDADGLGWTACVLSTTAAAVVVAPNAEDTITLDGTTDSAGDGITSASAAGDFVCLMVTSSSSNVANWTVLGRSGTWTAN